MSLQYAVLGFLQYGPRTGYELKKMFDSSVRHFWPAQQSHIYGALSSLTEKGWASYELVVQTERPNRKLYTITSLGREELEDWLSIPLIDRQMRSPFLIQIFFSGGMKDRKILTALESRAEDLRELIQEYSEGPVTVPTFSNDLPNREQFFWYLTLDYGLERLRFDLAWMESAIEKMRNKKYSEGMDGAFNPREKA
ncbi:PadR family transcriptional regulator [Candidatus Bipolaricaulota bacterium]|nr:PadR family transcriptional regulator [Candidatus Bipolaricaulota bacterium]